MSVNFVSLRMQNLKMGQLGAASAHNMRQVPVANADQNGYAERIFGDKEKDLEQILMAHLEHLGADFSKMGVKQNSDDRSKQTTVVNEYVLSASPEYFRPGRPEAAGEYDQERLDEWLKHATAWAQTEFGQHLLTIDLHCDEATPHLHICVAPLVEKTKNLRRTKAEIAEGAAPRTATVWSFNNLEINTRDSMRERQTSAAEALKSLGLHRGVPSKAKHETIKEYYQKLNQSIDNLSLAKQHKPNLSTLNIGEPPSPTLFNFGAMKKWINKAYRVITKTFPDLLQAETDKVNKGREKYNDLLHAAREYRNKFVDLKQAQLDIYDRFGNDPLALAQHLEKLAQQQRALKTESDRQYEAGIVVGRNEQQRALDAQKDGLAGQVDYWSSVAEDRRIDCVRMADERDAAISEVGELRGTLAQISALRAAKMGGEELRR